MRKLLSLATLASVIALPAFAQSFDPDVGTGNLVPPVANMGAAGAYAQAPAIYDRGYVRHRHAYRSCDASCDRPRQHFGARPELRKGRRDTEVEVEKIPSS